MIANDRGYGWQVFRSEVPLMTCSGLDRNPLQCLKAVVRCSWCRKVWKASVERTTCKASAKQRSTLAAEPVPSLCFELQHKARLGGSYASAIGQQQLYSCTALADASPWHAEPPSACSYQTGNTCIIFCLKRLFPCPGDHGKSHAPQ